MFMAMLAAQKRERRKLLDLNVHERAAAFGDQRDEFNVDCPHIRDPLPTWLAIWAKVDAVSGCRLRPGDGSLACVDLILDCVNVDVSPQSFPTRCA